MPDSSISASARFGTQTVNALARLGDPQDLELLRDLWSQLKAPPQDPIFLAWKGDKAALEP